MLLCPSATSDEEQLIEEPRRVVGGRVPRRRRVDVFVLRLRAERERLQRVAQQAQERHQPRRTRRAPRGFPRDARRVARATERVGGRERGRDGERRRRRFRAFESLAGVGIDPVGSVAHEPMPKRVLIGVAREGQERREDVSSRPHGDGSVSGAKFGFVENLVAARDERPEQRRVRAATAARADRDCSEASRACLARMAAIAAAAASRRSSSAARSPANAADATAETSASLGEGNRSPCRSPSVRSGSASSRTRSSAAALGGGGVQKRGKPPPARALEREVLGGPARALCGERACGGGDEPGRGARGDAKLVQRRPRRGDAVRRRTCDDATRRAKGARGAVSSLPAPSPPRHHRRVVFLNPSLWPVPETSSPSELSLEVASRDARGASSDAPSDKLGGPTTSASDAHSRARPRFPRRRRASNRGDDAVRDANANVSALTTRAISASASARASPGAGVAGPLGRRRERRRRRRGLRDGRVVRLRTRPARTRLAVAPSRGGTKPTRRVQRRAPRDEREHEPAHAARVHRLAHRLRVVRGRLGGFAQARRVQRRQPREERRRFLRTAPGTSASSPVARGARCASRAAPRRPPRTSRRRRRARRTPRAEPSARSPPSPRRPARASAPARRRARAPRTPARPSRGSGRAREAAPAPATATATGSRIQTRIPPRRFREKLGGVDAEVRRGRVRGRAGCGGGGGSGEDVGFAAAAKAPPAALPVARASAAEATSAASTATCAAMAGGAAAISVRSKCMIAGKCARSCSALARCTSPGARAKLAARRRLDRRPRRRRGAAETGPAARPRRARVCPRLVRGELVVGVRLVRRRRRRARRVQRADARVARVHVAPQPEPREHARLPLVVHVLSCARGRLSACTSAANPAPRAKNVVAVFDAAVHADPRSRGGTRIRSSRKAAAPFGRIRRENRASERPSSRSPPAPARASSRA